MPKKGEKLKPGDKNYRPARGNVASGKPARGNQPHGFGWGGPPKGASVHNSGKPRVMNMVTCKTPDEKRKLKEYRARRLEDILMNVAERSAFEHSKIAAASKLHSIYEGMPVARNLNATVTDFKGMTDDELRAELERVEREEASTIEGTAVEVMPPKLRKVVR
jgi:hypothetical protein